MSELVKIGKTTKNTYLQLEQQGFLIDFPDSEFRNESRLTGFGDVYIKSELVDNFNKLKKQVIAQNGSFPIL